MTNTKSKVLLTVPTKVSQIIPTDNEAVRLANSSLKQDILARSANPKKVY